MAAAPASTTSGRAAALAGNVDHCFRAARSWEDIGGIGAGGDAELHPATAASARTAAATADRRVPSGRMRRVTLLMLVLLMSYLWLLILVRFM